MSAFIIEDYIVNVYKQTYREQFLQSPFRKYCIQLWTDIPLREQSKYNNIRDQSSGTADEITVEWSINP